MLVSLTACQQPTYDELGDLPAVSDLDLEIICDQDTNLVTFTCNSTGMLPVWYFDDGTISTSTIVEKSYTTAGTYYVEVQAMSTNGMSADSVTLDFTLNNDYISPETQAMIEALCGGVDGTKSWVWNQDASGHFGCGASGSDSGTDWWSAGANSMSEAGMYDDTITFSASGEYSYNPGEGGTIYVNEGVTISPFIEYSAGDGAAYQAETSAMDGSWSFTYSGDTTYITLSSEMLAGYMPYDSLYQTPMFKVISIEEDLLVMLADNGSISWRYEFIPVTE